MTTPQLWSRLQFRLRDATKDGYRLGCDSWIARARGIPLYLSVRNDPAMSDVDPSNHLVDWLQSLVAQCCNFRWSGLPLEGLLTINRTLELLETLTIDGTRPIHILGPAIKLRSVDLKMPLDHFRHITLPWEHLREINIRARLLCGSVCVQLLRVCTCLQSAILSRLFQDTVQDAQIITLGNVTNRSLKVLDVEMGVARTAEYLFDALVLPALEELSIDFTVGEWPHAQFISFLTRSRCPLKKLRILNNEAAVPYLAEYQALLPCVSKSNRDSHIQDLW